MPSVHLSALQDSSPMKRKINFDLASYKISMVTTIPTSEIEWTDLLLKKSSFGAVMKGFWLKTSVAIKSIDYIGDGKYIIREISTLSQMFHENIIRIMAVAVGLSQIHIVMEYFNSDSLQNIIFNERVQIKYNLDEKKKNLISLQICRGIYFLHSNPKKVLHRDIKPANILVNKDLQVKICDLGLSKISAMATELLTTAGKLTTLGTVFYMAPEILWEYQPATVFSDMWSLSGTLVEL